MDTIVLFTISAFAGGFTGTCCGCLAFMMVIVVLAVLADHRMD